MPLTQPALRPKRYEGNNSNVAILWDVKEFLLKDSERWVAPRQIANALGCTWAEARLALGYWWELKRVRVNMRGRWQAIAEEDVV